MIIKVAGCGGGGKEGRMGRERWHGCEGGVLGLQKGAVVKEAEWEQVLSSATAISEPSSPAPPHTPHTQPCVPPSHVLHIHQAS